jgi:hypothetical protein
MITDTQLMTFANVLGASLFILVILFHFVAANNPKRQSTTQHHG